MEFIDALLNEAFLQRALLAGILASIAAGIIGSFIVVKRITYISGGIAHCCLGGIGGALFLNKVLNISWVTPTIGAIVAAILCALIIAWLRTHENEREDTIIGAMWAIGMAAGILLISKTPGYNEDLQSFLFGNILMVQTKHLYMLAGLDLLLLAINFVCFRQLQIICFDEEYAKTRGIKVESFFTMLLVATALTVVMLINVVGVVMVIALLTLPVAIASRFASTLSSLMILSSIIIAISNTAGLAISYSPNLPSGATTIILLGVVYVSTIIFDKAKR